MGQTLFTLTANDYVCKTLNKETFHQHFKFSVIKNFSSGCVSGTTVCRRCSFEQQNLVLTVLKTTISKNKPKKQFYRNYKKICSSNFNDDLKAVFKLMLYSCLMTLIKYFLMFQINMHHSKENYLEQIILLISLNLLRKAIMRRSYLKKVYCKIISKKNLNEYKKQKTF